MAGLLCVASLKLVSVIARPKARLAGLFFNDESLRHLHELKSRQFEKKILLSPHICAVVLAGSSRREFSQKTCPKKLVLRYQRYAASRGFKQAMLEIHARKLFIGASLSGLVI